LFLGTITGAGVQALIEDIIIMTDTYRKDETVKRGDLARIVGGDRIVETERKEGAGRTEKRERVLCRPISENTKSDDAVWIAEIRRNAAQRAGDRAIGISKG
jgi:hypothetical protein